MKKKLISVLLSAAMVMSVISGCGGSGQETKDAQTNGGETKAAQTSEQSTPEQTTAKETEGAVEETQVATKETESGTNAAAKTEYTGDPVTLRVLMSSGWTEDAMKSIEPVLNESGISLEVEAYDWNTYEGKQRLAGTSKGGEYDLIFLPGNAVNIFAKAGALVELNDVVSKVADNEDDYYDSVKRFSKVDDNWYVVPYSAEGMVYYYRTDLMTEDQLPKTIDEMYELGKSMTKDDMYGLAIPAGPGEAACSFWSYFLWSYGGTYFDEKWNPMLNTKEAVSAAEMFAKICKDCSPPGITTWQNEETVAAFQSGQLAAMINWPGYWNQINDESQSKVAGNIGVAPVPAGPVTDCPRFGTWGVGVTANCKNVDAAKVVVEEFTKKDTLRDCLQYTSSALRSLNEEEGSAKINPTIPASIAHLDTADERPPIPELNLYVPAVGAAINSIVAGNPAQETLDALNDEVRKIMEDGGYY